MARKRDGIREVLGTRLHWFGSAAEMADYFRRFAQNAVPKYGALLGSKLIMQTFFWDDFRTVTFVAWLIANVVSFDIFCENFFLSARSMAYKCFSLPLLSNCNSCYMVNCQLSFSSHFLLKLTSFCRFLAWDKNIRRLFSEHKNDFTRKIIFEISKLLP